ncbi:MAG: hypothetical protein AB7Y46_11030 [Armatimonadota bacterium]
MVSAELVVALKIPDVTALTAANAIRRRLGYEHTLKVLKRADYYRLELDLPDRAAAERLVREIAENTNLFVNPNKHVYKVRFPEDRGAARTGDGEYVVSVLVTNPDDSSGAQIAASLQSHHGYPQVQGVETGVLWTLHLLADSQEQALAMAEDITVTRSQSKGILMNPHFQEYTLWAGE